VGKLAKALQRISARELADGSFTQGERPVFQPKRAQGAKPPAVGKGKAAAGGGGGAAADMQETAAADREYWTNETITTTDGAFTWIVKPIKRVKLTSGKSIRFADPTP
jgi:hypothetical protein